jgi:hypothetical protein
MDREFLADLIRPLLLLEHARFETAAADEFAGAPETLDRVDLPHAADGLDVFGNDFIGRLRAQGDREQRDHSHQRFSH